MAETLCAFPDRDETIVTYLYDELDESARATFDAHLAICPRCRSEVSELASVRRQLVRWEPPAIEPTDSAALRAPRTPFWRTLPVWAQAAAAMLCLGVAAGLANLQIRYDREGLTIRTGWAQSAAAPASPAATAATPWRADLAALEQQLRTEFRQAPLPQVAAGDALSGATPRAMSDAEILRRVRALVEESDKRQQRELALRVAEVMNNVTAQRNADLLRIDRSLGLIRNNTAAELMKQRGTINYLVSTTQDKR